MDKKNSIGKFASGIYFIEHWIMTILFLIMLLFMFIQVFARYVIHSPLAWTEEVMRFTFIVAGFLGAAVATYERKHVEINFLTLIVTKATKSERKQTITFAFFDLIKTLICTVFCGYLAGLMFEYAMDLQAKNQLSTAMLMPMWWIGYAIAVSLALCSLHFLIHLMDEVRIMKCAIKGGIE